jgi:ribosomal protein S18 acetylase RimI-like enzyme
MAAAGVITIKGASPRHRDRVSEIVEATGIFRPDEADIALEVFDGAVEHPGVDYNALGAFDEDGQMVGFACFGPTPCTVGTWDLYWIAVDPGGHRQGVGRKLMDACEQRIAVGGGRLIVVETSSRTDYGPTRAFYEALGYSAAARVPGFYADGDDLVVYTKRLGTQAKATI